MIATHPHEDHIGGLPAVLNAVPVDLVLSPVIIWDTKRWENLKHYADEQGAPIIIAFRLPAGDIFRKTGAEIDHMNHLDGYKSIKKRRKPINLGSRL